MRVNAFTILRDVGYFCDTFKTDVLELDVMPWLYSETNKQIELLEGHNAYPNTLISSHIQTRGKTHVDRVQQYRDMIDARRAAEKKAEEDKIAAK